MYVYVMCDSGGCCTYIDQSPKFVNIMLHENSLNSFSVGLKISLVLTCFGIKNMDEISFVFLANRRTIFAFFGTSQLNYFFLSNIEMIYV